MSLFRSITICLLILICALPLSAQFEDHFNDLDFSNNPPWTGDVNNFEIDSDTLLHLIAPMLEEESYLSTPSQAIENASWSFWLRMGFNPSSTSKADIYLVSDQADVVNGDGYFVRVGNTEDEVSLYKKESGSSIEIIDGIDNLLDMSNVTVRVMVTRDMIGNWELFADSTGGTNFSPQGSVFNDDIQNSFYFGINCDYIASRSTLFWFDDFVVTGEPFTDSEAPVLTEIEATSSNTLLLNFSENLENSSAELLTNYTWSGLGNPDSATLTGSLVTLTFSNDFPNGIEQTLEISGVQDIANNEIAFTIAPFTYFLFEIAESRDVVFNEILADPTPGVGLPEAEFIEIYNVSDKVIQLENWELVNSTTSKSLTDHILLPDSFLILCDNQDVELFESFGNVMGITSFNALTNSADSLTLINEQSSIIDIVKYTDEWYQDVIKKEGGWTLEQINPELTCSDVMNWLASVDESGGTPGKINSIYNNSPDITPPTVTAIDFPDAQSLLLFFNEPMNTSSLLNGTYAINNGISVVDVNLNNTHWDQVILALSAPLDTAVAYILTITNVFDCQEVPYNSSVEIEIFLGFTPRFQDVIINEIMADPTPSLGLPEAEYLEIFNRTDKLLDLSGASISGAIFPSNTFIQPDSFLIITSVNNLISFIFYPQVVGLENWSSSFLTNSGKELIFKLKDETLIDYVIYEDSWYKDNSKKDGGWSLELINPNEPCRAGDNWIASIAQQGGTPGSANSVLNLAPDLSGPRLIDIYVTGNQELELVFNERLDSLSVILSDYTFSSGITVSSINNVAPAYKSISLTLLPELEESIIYSINISGLNDCSGNPFVNESEIYFGLPETPQPGDIIINEILFNPPENGLDFVEIYNLSMKVISLKDWKIGQVENGIPSNFKMITAFSKIMLPGDYLVLTEDPIITAQQYPLGKKENYFEITDLPSFDNSDGTVILALPDINVSDEFSYQEDYHFALLNNVEGVSLERIDFLRLTDDPTNWHSASETVGFGTPGYRNSQAFNGNFINQAFEFEPKIFSPNNDGIDDFLTIHYELNEPGFVGNITIFDTKGRVERKLMRNELLGREGEITWDGICDNGEKARIGIYIVFFEIFDLKGEVDHFKKTCVVADKL